MRLSYWCGGCQRIHRWRKFAQFILWIYLLDPSIVCKTQAAEWSLLPSMGLQGVYNSNLLFTSLPHEATYGYMASPAAEFAGKTERLDVSGRVRADFASYYGGVESRFTNVFLPLALHYKTEEDLLDFAGGFVRDNTLMGELRTTGVILGVFTQRNQWTAKPSWTRKITENLSSQSNFQFIDTTYENGLSLGLVDYQLIGGSGGLLYELTEQDQIQLSGSYTNFYTTNGLSPFRATFPGVNVGLTHAFTETLTGAAYGGPRFVSSTTRTTSGNINAQNTVWLFGASLVKKLESTSIRVSVTRDVFPSGFGLLLQTDQAGATVSHDISETLTASLDSAGYRASAATALTGGSTFPEQLYFYATPKIAWKFLEWWKLELSYTYGRREVPSLSDLGISNAAVFMLTYYPPRLAFSN